MPKAEFFLAHAVAAVWERRGQRENCTSETTFFQRLVA
jgi:hypothetical protein